MKTTEMTVLITGGGAGIGLSLAKAFQQAGNEVIICGRNLDTLAKAAADVTGIEFAQCDIGSYDSVRALADEFAAQVNVLVNNASISKVIDFLASGSTFDERNEEVNINLAGTLCMLQLFLPSLQIQPQAAIVNVTSALAFIPSADRPIYCATKAALHSLSLSLRHQLRGTSIQVFELIPPLTDTPMAADVHGIPKLAPDKVAQALLEGMARDCLEITPGLTRATKWMSRIAPKFGFNQFNG